MFHRATASRSIRSARPIATLKPLTLVLLQAFACHALAQDAGEDGKSASTFGQGQTRQVQNITRYDLSKALPGTSPLKTLEKLPGVLFESADAFGTYEWSTRFSIRGFSQNQLGFTLDGVPLGDMSYGNNNGLHVSRAISSENITRVSVSQGAGAVGTASANNLGGTVQVFSADPANKLTFTGAQTIGSDSTYRTFARFDTGAASTGTKAYFSVMRHKSDKWKGDGPQDLDQVNIKFVQPFGEHKLSAFYNYSDRRETDYQDHSLELTNRRGWNWDNYAPDWTTAVNVARSPVCTTAYNHTCDDAYYLGRGLRRDKLAGVTFDAKLGGAAIKSTLYHHTNKGQGQWYTPYAATSPSIPIAIRSSEYDIHRNGLLTDISFDAANHSINGGFWYEDNEHGFARRFYGVLLGADGKPVETNRFLAQPTRTQFLQSFVTKTTQFYLQDTIALMDDALNINIGMKSPKVEIDATSINASRAGGSLTAKKSFLPQAGMRYEFGKGDEVFASIAKNMRAYNPGVNGPFWTSQSGFNIGAPKLKPETSTTMDIGYRFTRGPVSGSVAAYTVEFNDRLILLTPCPSIVGCASTLANVGKVKTRGVEAAAVWTLARNWLWFNAFTYNDSQYKSNYQDGDTLVRVAGKQVVDSPKTMFNSEITFDDGAWYARANAKHTAKRYFTYTNDGVVPAFWVANVTAGWRTKSWGMLKDVTI